jgi:hypothetical protein
MALLIGQRQTLTLHLKVDKWFLWLTPSQMLASLTSRQRRYLAGMQPKRPFLRFLIRECASGGLFFLPTLKKKVKQAIQGEK